MIELDVFDLMATIKLDSKDYERELNNQESKTTSFGSKISQAFGTVAKVGAVAFGAAATAVGALTKSVVSEFGEQEQLVGGVKKLYGNMGMSVEEYAQSVGKSVAEVSDDWQKLETAQNTVLENAKNAYKTAGMSANQYMSTATSFSAALINSLGGDMQKAADMTDVAMTAISDNFNTFGGDIGMIQGAFQGFAKQNYTMLDNLKLGYGGTKKEMERLIADANAYAAAQGESADLTIDSFADIVTAIDLVQKKQGIYGTTAREAATTIQGSLGMLKGAWSNLLAGLGDADADINKLVDNVVSSAESVVKNILPVVKTALAGVGRIVTDLAPMIAEKLPELVEMVLPPLVGAATSLLVSLAGALPGLFMTIVNMIPTLIQTFISSFTAQAGALSEIGSFSIEQILNSITEFLDPVAEKGFEIINKLAEGIFNNIPAAVDAIQNVVSTVVEWIFANAPQFLNMGLELISNLAEGILANAPKVISGIYSIRMSIQKKLLEAMPQILQKGAEFISNLAQGVMNNLPAIASAFGNARKTVLSNLAEALPDILRKGIEIVMQLVNGILNALPSLASTAGEMIGTILSGIVPHLPRIIAAGLEIIGQLAVGIIRGIPKVVAAVPQVIAGIVKGFTGHSWGEVGSNIISGIAGGISAGVGAIANAAKSAAASALGAAKRFLGIASPSKVMRDQVGKWIPEGIAQGIERNLGVVQDAMDDISAMHPVVSTTVDGRAGGTAILGDDDNMRDLLLEAFERMRFEIDGREFARLVRDVRTA